MSETKKFKTETKRLLDLMINSIYTNFFMNSSDPLFAIVPK